MKKIRTIYQRTTNFIPEFLTEKILLGAAVKSKSRLIRTKDLNHETCETSGRYRHSQTALYRLGQFAGRRRRQAGKEFTPEHTIYLVEDITGYMIDKVEIIKPHFELIFEEELNSWHRLVSDWPAHRDLTTFLEWFEVEIHSLVLYLHGGRLKTER